MPVTLEKKVQYRDEARERYAAMSPEQKETYLARKRRSKRHARSKMTPEQKRNQSLLNRDRLLRKAYGLSVDQWNIMFDAQGSCCAICKSATSEGKADWHTDHCHSSGKVRGILCRKCNIMLGYLNDDVSILLAAATYITVCSTK